jgi:hypothetical protein
LVIVNDLKAIWAWFYSELRELGLRLREPFLWLSLVAALLCSLLAYQAQPSAVIAVGGDTQSHKRHYDAPFLLNNTFNAPEPGSGDWWSQQPYRWTADRAEIGFDGVGGGQWIVRVLAASGRPDGSSIETQWQIGDAAPQTVWIHAGSRVYSLLGPSSGGDLKISVNAPRFEAPGDSRNLGFVLHRIALIAADGKGMHAPAWGQIGWMLLIVGMAYLLARRLALSPAWGLAIALGLSLVFVWMLLSHRLALTIWTPTLALLSVAAYVLALLALPALRAAARASGIEPDAQELGLAVGSSLAASIMRLAGVWHPYARFSDLGFNINNFESFIRGRIFMYAGLPTEVGGGQAPYPPAQYILFAPLRLLFGPDRQQQAWLIQSANGVLEAASAALIWLLMRRSGQNKAASLFAAALYITVPPLVRSYSIGEYANIFAQIWLVPLLLFLQFHGGERRWSRLCIGGALLTMIVLSHTGVTISTVALLLGWLMMYLLFQRPVFPWRLVGAGAAAALFAALFFYTGYWDLVSQRLNGSSTAAEAATTSRPFLQKLWLEIIASLSQAKGISIVLLVASIVGSVLLWRAPGRLDVLVYSGWLGALFSLAILFGSDQATRWTAYLFPILSISAGALFGRWWQANLLGRVSAVLAMLAISGYGLLYWQQQIVNYLH